MLLVAMLACALPAIAQSDETAKRVHVFPQLADGGGWQSVLLVTNVCAVIELLHVRITRPDRLDRFS